MSNCEVICRNRSVHVKRIVFCKALELFVDLTNEVVRTIFLNEKNAVSREGIHNTRCEIALLIEHIVIVIVRIDNSQDIVSCIATITVNEVDLVGINLERSIRNGIHVRTGTVVVVSNHPLICTVSQAVEYESSTCYTHNRIDESSGNSSTTVN